MQTDKASCSIFPARTASVSRTKKTNRIRMRQLSTVLDNCRHVLRNSMRTRTRIVWLPPREGW
ncbi:hypothetical protein BDV96DRAFT_579183 [Lophiotrema nucula]|uniref:Uncharacterized protein n=1 Tax=Lophiotrema nucula TaxID=690887 RepID=A0A6A5Z594_9PLEO|nr:hypothetical protein BDV96DRAFT_579183 [Lophiotrema nucula]